MDAKLLLGDSIYKFFMNTECTSFCMRDAKLLLRDSIYNLKLYINKVYLLLRDAKFLWGIPFTS